MGRVRAATFSVIPEGQNHPKERRHPVILSLSKGCRRNRGRIAGHLKHNGVFCSGGECLNEEFTPEQLVNPPDLYNFVEPVWAEDFLKSHSPGWWADHVARSELLQLVSCKEVEDGRRFYEEQALLSEPQGYFGLSAQQARELEIRQIEYGRKYRPYMTVYQLVAKRP